MDLYQINDRDQDKQGYFNIRIIKNPYTESEIPTINRSSEKLYLTQDLQQLFNKLPALKKAMETNNQDDIFEYFKSFSDIIHNANCIDMNHMNCIEFILPYINKLINTETNEKVLNVVLLSLQTIVSISQDYAQEFINSSAYQQLILIIQKNIADCNTAISINIIISLSHYEDLYDILHSTFSIESIVDCFLSEYYYDLSKESFILLLGEYLFGTTDNEKISQIFSCILRCLAQPNLKIDLSLIILHIIGQFYLKNDEKRIDILPQEIIQFISNHIYEIIKSVKSNISSEIFYLIHILIIKGVVINYPVERIYEFVLDKNTEDDVRERVIEMLAISIKVRDDINYSKLFVTESINKIIEHCLENSSIRTKNHSLILLGIILATDNLELFISILNSSAFINLLDFVESIDNIDSLVLSIGILGSAFHLLQLMIPDSDEFQFFISSILSTEIIENLSHSSEQYTKYSPFFMSFCSLFQSE